MTITNTKAILLNGPLACGKSVAVDYLQKQLGYKHKIVKRYCKNSLHQLTMKLFNVPEKRYWEIYNSRELKEVPLVEFVIEIPDSELEALEDLVGFLSEDQVESVGWKTTMTQLSIRQAMIYVSEILIKPRFGEDYFGLARANEVESNEVVIDDSCGFLEELPPLIDKIGNENILLVRIHQYGKDFSGDSRKYIPEGVLTNVVDIWNNGSEQEYLDKVLDVVKEFLEEK